MSNPLISVIIPVYKVEKYLERCIISVISQTYKNIEVILVDDGSPDNCPFICDEWAKKDDRIRVIHKDNGGLSDARNVGLENAHGTIISFVDSVDWIEECAFEQMINRMLLDDSDIVSCGVNWVSEEMKTIRIETVDFDEVLNTRAAMHEILIDNKLKQYVWNKIYKYEIINDILFEKEKYHEDVFWSYQVIGRAKKISLINQIYYHYFQREGSIMAQSYSITRLDALDAAKNQCEYVKIHFPDLFDEALCRYIGSCHYHLQCAVRARLDKNVVRSIIEKTKYRKEGNALYLLDAKQKFWYYMFTFFPVSTCRIRNVLRIGI